MQWIQHNRQCAKILDGLEEIQYGLSTNLPDMSALESIMQVREHRQSTRDLLIRLACHDDMHPLYAYKILKGLNLTSSDTNIPFSDNPFRCFVQAVVSKDEHAFSLHVHANDAISSTSYKYRNITRHALKELCAQHPDVFKATLSKMPMVDHVLSQEYRESFSHVSQVSRQIIVQKSFRNHGIGLLYVETPHDFNFVGNEDEYKQELLEAMLLKLEVSIPEHQRDLWGPLLLEELSDSGIEQARFINLLQACPMLLQAYLPKNMEDLSIFLGIDPKQEMNQVDQRALLSWHGVSRLDFEVLCKQPDFLLNPAIIDLKDLSNTDVEILLNASVAQQKDINILSLLTSTSSTSLAQVKTPALTMSLWDALQGIEPPYQWEHIPMDLWRAWYGDCPGLDVAASPLEWMKSQEPELATQHTAAVAALDMLGLPPSMRYGYYSQIQGTEWNKTFPESFNFNMYDKEA